MPNSDEASSSEFGIGGDRPAPLVRRLGAIELRVPVKPPDQVQDQNDGDTLLAGHRDQG